MKTKVNYYVILTVVYDQKRNSINDILTVVYDQKRNSINDILTKKIKSLFYPTDVEKNPDGMYDNDNVYSRKYCGEVTADQLVEIQKYLGLNETCKTMGSLTEYGWLNSISFSCYDDYDTYEINAYISPILTGENELNARFDKLPENQKEVVKTKVSKSIQAILDYLENDFNDELILPEYCREFEIDLYQLQLAL